MDEISHGTYAYPGDILSTPLAGSCDIEIGAKDPDDSEGCLFLLAVFGKSGTGKSSLCNQIAGRENLFSVGHGLSCETTRCQKESVVQYGHRLMVMDTPGEGEMMEITKTVKEVGDRVQGKVCIVFCVRCDSRYAVEEHSIYLQLKDAWGNDKDFYKRLLVAFTHGDQLSDDSDDDGTSATGTASAIATVQTTDTEGCQPSNQVHATIGQTIHSSSKNLKSRNGTDDEVPSNAGKQNDVTRPLTNKTAVDPPNLSSCINEGETENNKRKDEWKITANEPSNSRGTTDRDLTASDQDYSRVATDRELTASEENNSRVTTDRELTASDQDYSNVTTIKEPTASEKNNFRVTTDRELTASDQDYSNVTTDKEPTASDRDNTRVTTDIELTTSAPDSNKETDKEYSAKDRKLRQMLSATWPQLKLLTENAQNRFVIFSNKKIKRKNVSVFNLIRLVEKMDLTAERPAARSWQRNYWSFITATRSWWSRHPCVRYLVAAAGVVVVLTYFPFLTTCHSFHCSIMQYVYFAVTPSLVWDWGYNYFPWISEQPALLYDGWW